jgi:hypothetical protein
MKERPKTEEELAEEIVRLIEEVKLGKTKENNKVRLDRKEPGDVRER